MLYQSHSVMHPNRKIETSAHRNASQACCSDHEDEKENACAITWREPILCERMSRQRANYIAEVALFCDAAHL